MQKTGPLGTATISNLTDTLVRADIQRATQWAEALPDAEYSIEDLAHALHMSRASLYRKMKNLLDTTPLEHLKELRLERARQMLLTTTHPVSEIMAQCGFLDASHFARMFKAKHGLSATEYRKTPQKR